MRQPPLVSFAEKEFYLDEFHEKSVLFALRAMDWTTATRMHAALEVFATLLRNDTRVLLLLETSDEEGAQRCARALHTQLSQVAKTPHTAPAIFCADASIDQICLQMWEVLRDSRVFVGLWPPEAPVSLADCAQRAAIGLRVYKLVYLDPLGGLAHDGKILSFMSGPGLQELLRPGRAEEVGLGSRRPVLEAIHRALVGGVMSVSLCPLAGLERELFTYEGCGTLFTRGEYCQVEKLGIDDFHEVEKLLQRAEQAGYLKPRTLQETARLLLYGYSARLGAASMEPAGFCALLPYAEDQAAEIVGLITITRYQGEGVGGQLVEAMIQEGTKQGLMYVFACTTQEGAQRLFTRHGFQRVPPDAVAAAKWHGYDPARQQHVAVYRRDLTPSNLANTVHHPLV